LTINEIKNKGVFMASYSIIQCAAGSRRQSRLRASLRGLCMGAAIAVLAVFSGMACGGSGDSGGSSPALQGTNWTNTTPLHFLNGSLLSFTTATDCTLSFLGDVIAGTYTVSKDSVTLSLVDTSAIPEGFETSVTGTLSADGKTLSFPYPPEINAVFHRVP
jgi:hypothetical protein